MLRRRQSLGQLAGGLLEGYSTGNSRSLRSGRHVISVIVVRQKKPLATWRWRQP